jgi:hypothetical protein
MDDFITAFFGEEKKEPQLMKITSIASSERADEQLKYKDHFKVFKVENGEKQKEESN